MGIIAARFKEVMIRRYLALYVGILLYSPCASNVCFSQESDDKSVYITKLKEFANSIEFFPLYAVVPIIGERWSVWDRDWWPAPEHSFYEFMEFARSAEKADMAACESYLKEANPRERCLIFLVFYCSLDLKYLPIIAEFRNDDKPAFVSLAFYQTERKEQNVAIDIQFTSQIYKILSEKSRNNEKFSRREYMTWRQYERVLMSSVGSGDSFDKERGNDFKVRDFAQHILWLWGCTQKKLLFPDDIWPEYSPDDWILYDAEAKPATYYVNLYTVSVACALPENYDAETVAFLKKVEKLPLELQMNILTRTYLYVNVTNYRTRTGQQLFYTSRNYPFPCTIIEFQDFEDRVRIGQMFWHPKAVFVVSALVFLGFLFGLGKWRRVF